MEFFLYILLAIGILLLMILIHELGHYTAGKIFKFKINEFSIGFGPKLLQKKLKNGEKFTLRAFPLGGYCAFEDDNGTGEVTERSFAKEKPYKRIIVFAAGAIFNIVSAVLFSFIYIWAVGYQVPKVASVTYDFEADKYYNNLQEGDLIVAIDGRKINVMNTYYDVLDAVKKDANAGKKGTFAFTVTRFGETREVDVQWQAIVPSYVEFGFSYTVETDGVRVREVAKDSAQKPYNSFLVDDIITAVNGTAITAENKIEALTKDMALGIKAEFTVLRAESEIKITAEKARVFYEEYDGFGFTTPTMESQSAGFGEALLYAVPFTGKMSWMILGAFGGLFTGRVALTDMAGPVGTVAQMAEISQSNWRNILILLPLIASNLAIFNLLPFPALDGARIVFTGIEWVRRKPVNRNVEAWIHLIGMAALILFVIVIDVVGFIVRGGAGLGSSGVRWLRL